MGLFVYWGWVSALSDLGRVLGLAMTKPRKGRVTNALDEGKGIMLMRKFQVFGLMLFAVLAFSAVATASAFAEVGEWLVENVKPAEALPAETEGLLIVARLVSSTNSAVLQEVDCEGILDGTIGPGVADTVTAVLNLAKELIMN